MKMTAKWQKKNIILKITSYKMTIIALITWQQPLIQGNDGKRTIPWLFCHSGKGIFKSENTCFSWTKPDKEVSLASAVKSSWFPGHFQHWHDADFVKHSVLCGTLLTYGHIQTLKAHFWYEVGVCTFMTWWYILDL